MNRTVLAFLAAAASLGLQPCLAQPSPTPEALVDRLLALLPDANQLNNAAVPPPEPAEVSRLNALNPGHEAEIMTALPASQACLSPLVHDALIRRMRQLIRDLGTTKVNRLIEFYQSADFRTLAAIDARQTGGGSLTEADRREAARIIAAYPITEFVGRLQDREFAVQDQAFIAGATRCSLAKRDAFQQHGLRYR
jgi:hypothetical protein